MRPVKQTLYCWSVKPGIRSKSDQIEWIESIKCQIKNIVFKMRFVYEYGPVYANLNYINWVINMYIYQNQNNRSTSVCEYTIIWIGWFWYFSGTSGENYDRILLLGFCQNSRSENRFNIYCFEGITYNPNWFSTLHLVKLCQQPLHRFYSEVRKVDV